MRVLLLHNQQMSHEFAEKTLTLMRDLGIPAIPKNYIIWYSYASDADPNLSRSLEVLLSNKSQFSDDLSNQIYEQFFAEDGESELVNKTGEQLDALLQNASDVILSAGDNAEAYGKTLDGMSKELDSGPDDVRTIVSSLIAETRKMQESNQSLTDQLESSISQVKSLQTDLDQARAQAFTDGLTNIPNRKKFDMVLRETAVEAMETGDPLCLLLMDIDFFKKFNDNYGHQLGDRVLQLVAATLIQNLKGADTAARYGGEEFGVILPKTKLDNALTVGDHLREAVASKKIVRKNSGTPLGSITLSVGAAEFKFGEPLEDMVKRADAALYTAKHQGRNRVVSENDIDANLQSVA